MSGVNEVLAVYLMAAKLGIPVCPHAGGVGLCNMVPHLHAFDFVCLTGTTENRVVEWVDHLHQHFIDPPSVQNARYCFYFQKIFMIILSHRYVIPSAPGYSTQFKDESIEDYAYPDGRAWRTLFAEGKYKDPSLEKKLLPMVNESAKVKKPPMFEDSQKSYIF